MTIAIMGILAGIVLPRFFQGSFIKDLTLRAATAQVASDIRYTRRLAITNSGHYLIVFNFTRKEYAIYKDTISLATQIGETKKIPPEITCFGTNQFDFYSFGNALFIGDGLSLSVQSSQKRIMVEPPTGAVTIEKISATISAV